MKKFIFLFSIISFCILSGFIDPDVVFADVNPGIIDIVGTNSNEYQEMQIDCTSFPNNKVAIGLQYNFGSYCYVCLYVDDPDGIVTTCNNRLKRTGSGDSWTTWNDNSPYIRTNGITVFTFFRISRPIISSNVFVVYDSKVDQSTDNFYSSSTLATVRDYFDIPEVETIPDADLDIVGLSCYILNDQTGSLDLKESLRNTFYGFTQYYFNVLTDGIFSDSFLPPILDESSLTGSIVNYVPGVALSWVSPSLDSDITYTVWIDGKSTVNYKTSADPIVNFIADLKPATSVSYAKLKINEGALTQSGNSFYQYNTNLGFETILNYIETNGQITPPSTPWQRYSYIGLDTKISRVYIQASKIIDGDNHVGALSYVDIIDGLPSVHEGVTSIDDVTASDPDTGTGNNVGTPYNVSGDTIYMGDTINNGDTYNIYGGSGLVVSGGNPLNTVKTLFNAIFKLVQALYLTKLLKWILIGFTGNPLGDFIL